MGRKPPRDIYRANASRIEDPGPVIPFHPVRPAGAVDPPAGSAPSVPDVPGGATVTALPLPRAAQPTDPSPDSELSELLFESITALETLHTGIDELVAVVGAAGHLATEPPADPERLARVRRQLDFLVLLAARRGESLGDEAAELVPDLLERFHSLRR